MSFDPLAVALRDGTEVAIRAIQADDASRLQALVSRLSPESTYRRFLIPLRSLPHEQAQQLAQVDYASRMALVATRRAGVEEIVAVARYAITDPARPDEAEAAVVVEDPYQGQGLGRILLEQLIAYARTQGIRFFLAYVHQTNEPMMRFIWSSGFPVDLSLDGGLWRIVVRLERQDPAPGMVARGSSDGKTATAQ